MLQPATIDLLGSAPLRILILSPQPWVGLQVSKHHYAREFAALGHHVYFINPPGEKAELGISPSGTPGIDLVDHPRMPLRRSKYRARRLFDFAARRRARALARLIGPFDLLWDFDNARQFADHRPFGAPLSILHIVDRLDPGDVAHRHADLILGVDALLLNDVGPGGRPAHVVGHGLSPLFADRARHLLATPTARESDAPITIGFIGNLAQPAMDRARMLALVDGAPDARFRFIGPVQGETPDARAWVDDLERRSNVELAGLLTGDALIEATEGVDIWLLCYDLARDRNNGVNSHKLLEYFALGGEVVSSWIAAQADAPGIFMPAKGAPDEILDRLREAIDTVRGGRGSAWRARAERALASSYRANVNGIAGLLAAIPTCPRGTKE